MASYAARSLQLLIHNDVLENFEEVETYDAISMIQVVSHFFDLHWAFAAAARATRAAGYWLIEGWKADSVVARLRGRNWHVYNPPSVLHYFTMKSLDLLAMEFGFTRIATGRPQKYITASHAAALFDFLAPRSKSLQIAGRLAHRLPDAFVFPYLGDDIFWALYERTTPPSASRATKQHHYSETISLDM